jgi:hypothetical protein
VHFATKGIGCAAEVDDTCDSRAADCNVSDSSAPWAAKSVGNDYRHIDTESVAQSVANPSSRAIGIDRKQSGPTTLDIRKINASVCADKTVLGFADDEISAAAKNSNGFAFNERFVAERIVGVDGDKPVFSF